MNLVRRVAVVLALTLGLSAPAFPAQADENGLRTGMTWTVTGQQDGYVHVGADGQTNPYSGDTEIDHFLPALCLYVDGRGAPGGIAYDLYNGWAQGSVRATAAVRGDALNSPNAADSLCANTFGAGWRLAEFHDGRYGDDFSESGGWSFWAAAGGNLLPGTRFWVAINDQPANPWDSAGSWPEPLPTGTQNDLILRTDLSEMVNPLLRVTANTNFQNLVRNAVGRQFDGDTNALMTDVISEAEAAGVVDPNAADWLEVKNIVARFGNINGQAYQPQIYIPNYDEGVITSNPVTMAVQGSEGQTTLPTYTLDSGGQVVAHAPVDEAYAETYEVWVLTINDELGAGDPESATVAGDNTSTASATAREESTMGIQAVCNPNGRRNDQGQEFITSFRVPDPSSVEYWWQGKLEVRMIVVGKGGVEIKNAYWGKIARKTARNGKVVNLFLTTWDRAQLGDYWAYKWVEEDNGPKIEMSLGLSGTIQNALTITEDVKATMEAKNDDMGSGLVGFTESTYITYGTGTVEWNVCSMGGNGGTGVDNYARQATVAASSTFPGYDPARVNDGDENTSLGGSYSWANSYGDANYPGLHPQWVQLDFGVDRTIGRAVIFTSQGYPIRDFDIQIWNGSYWETVGAPVRGNTALSVTVTFTPRTTRLVRVLGYSGPDYQQGYVRVNEFEVYSS
jgi:F5/8 type C domain